MKLGVKRGVVVSEHVGYLDVGLRNGLQHMFLPPEAAEYAGADVDVRASTRTLTRARQHTHPHPELRALVLTLALPPTLATGTDRHRR